jgi:hypothetical protein
LQGSVTFECVNWKGYRMLWLRAYQWVHGLLWIDCLINWG